MICDSIRPLELCALAWIPQFPILLRFSIKSSSHLNVDLQADSGYTQRTEGGGRKGGEEREEEGGERREGGRKEKKEGRRERKNIKNSLLNIIRASAGVLKPSKPLN